MKRLGLILALIASTAAYAQQINTWSTQPDTVIVYPQQALIRSEVVIQLPAGKSTFVLTGLGASWQQNSLQVASRGNWKILSVTTEKSDGNPHQAASKDSIFLIDQVIRNLEMQIRVTEQQEKIIMANASIKSESDGLIPEDFKEFMAIFEQKFTEIGKRRLMLQENLLSALARKKVWEDQGRQTTTQHESAPNIRIIAEAPNDMKSSLLLSYVVDQASWAPHYTARVQDTQLPLSVVFQADIQQQTGLNWEKAHVILSTARPILGGQKPIIVPEFLQVRQPMTTFRREAKVAMEPMMLASAADMSAPAASNVIFENADLFMQYELPGWQRIPHGGLPTRLDVQSFTWQPTYTYSAVPKQSSDGYVQAELNADLFKNLLSGPLTLFWKGTFLGESYLDTKASDQPTSISLGRDQSIIAKMEEILEKKSFRTLGQAVRETQVYRITLTNRKEQDIQLKIDDQVPVSQDSRIEVTFETTPEGKVNSETGLLQWDVTIPAGGSVVLEKTIQLKYPKGIVLQRLPGWN